MRTLFFLTGALLFSSIASAELLNGTITNVDENAQRVTLMRSDTQESVMIDLQDASAFGQLRSGSQVTLDASPGATGSWTAASISPVTTASVLSDESTSGGTATGGRSPSIRDENGVPTGIINSRGPSITPNIQNSVGTPGMIHSRGPSITPNTQEPANESGELGTRG